MSPLQTFQVYSNDKAEAETTSWPEVGVQRPLVARRAASCWPTGGWSRGFSQPKVNHWRRRRGETTTNGVVHHPGGKHAGTESSSCFFSHLTLQFPVFAARHVSRQRHQSFSANRSVRSERLAEIKMAARSVQTRHPARFVGSLHLVNTRIRNSVSASQRF